MRRFRNQCAWLARECPKSATIITTSASKREVDGHRSFSANIAKRDASTWDTGLGLQPAASLAWRSATTRGPMKLPSDELNAAGLRRRFHYSRSVPAEAVKSIVEIERQAMLRLSKRPAAARRLTLGWVQRRRRELLLRYPKSRPAVDVAFGPGNDLAAERIGPGKLAKLHSAIDGGP